MFTNFRSHSALCVHDIFTLSCSTIFRAAMNFSTFLNNRPLKSKITLIVAPLISIALYGMGFELWATYKRYQRSQELERANAVSDYFLKAAGLQAKERGFTSTALSNPNDKQTLSAIAKLRTQGDLYVDSALTLVQEAAATLPVIQPKLEAFRTARSKRDAMRTSNDAVLGQSAASANAVKQWIAAQTTMIMTEHALAESLFLGESRLETILALNSSIKNSVFYASEFAGRERANIGAVIGSGKPIDAERYASLMQFRGIVQEHCDNILLFSTNPAVTPPIKAAIEQMQTVFLTEFETTRKAVYKASAEANANASADSAGNLTAQYPLSTAEWIQRSTTGINALLQVSESVSVEVARLSAEDRKAGLYAVLTALGIFVVLLCIILLSNKIFSLVVERVTRLRNTAQAVERGDLAARSDDTTTDEIGELTTSLNGMIAAIKQGMTALSSEKASIERKVQEATREIHEQREHLQHGVESMLQAVEAFSHGDLTRRIETQATGDLDRLFNAYNLALENVRAMMANILAETEHTASASTEITASIEHMSKGIQRQHEQANYIAISTEEMSKTIEETSRNITLAAEQSQEASKEAVLSGTALQAMMNAVFGVSTIVQRSSESVSHLNESSEQISAMSASIAEIADQTNLLALNAAIEAARAGEQGRGFAVVADEVRKLAERTQEATKEISALVRSIQTDTETVVVTMKQGVREVEQTQRLVAEANTSLEKIIDRTRRISDFISQLAVTSEEQHTTSEDIAGNMGVMTMVVSQSASVSEQIAKTSQSLNQMTLTVQQMLQTFRVEQPLASPMLPQA